MTIAHLPGLAAVGVRTLLVLLYLFGGLRLLGKRHINPLHVCDLAFLMGMANSVQNAMTNGKGDLSVGITAAATLLLVGWLATALVLRSPKWEKHVIGVPTVLIHQGKIEWANLRRENITEGHLMKALREHELPDPEDVRLAVLEVDGTISVVAK